jgi:hypothetical protein
MTFIAPSGRVENLKCAVGSTAVKTAYQTQAWVYIADSQVDYTPVPGADWVVYKYQFLANWSDNANDLLQFKIMYDSSASLDPSTQISSFSSFPLGFQSNWGGNQNYQSNLINLQFAIPAWTGVRRVITACYSYSGATIGGTLHWTDKFREDDIDSDVGANTTSSFVFKPHYMIYSVTE